jgi:hypothetical protein
MSPDVPGRALCSRCMQSFVGDELTSFGDERLCIACLVVAERAPASPGTAPAPALLEAVEAPLPDGLIRGFLPGARAWTSGRMRIIRLPVLVFLVYVLVRHLADPSFQSILKPINLGIHELGHYVFRPFGDLLTAAGGSILQCLAPVIGAVIFLRQRDYFAIAFAFGWLATNLYDVAEYVGDARARVLPLVTPGGGVAQHDWHYLLGRMGILKWDGALETILRILATIVLLAAIIFGGWLLWRMSPRRAPRTG